MLRTPNEIFQTTDKFYNLAGIPNIIGAVNETLRIKQPDIIASNCSCV